MKLLLLFVILGLFVASSFAQLKSTTAADYNGAFRYAVSETNAAFPFVFTVVVEEFENGRKTSSETEINERQDAGIERITHTKIANGNKTISYQVSTGFGSVYCSSDNSTWQGPQQYECDSGPIRLYGQRQTEKSEYGFEEKVSGGEKIKIYREYLIFKSSSGDKKEFKETVATIDSRGLFISIVNNEGTLGPKDITLTRKQTWDMKTKFKPIVAPK